MVDAKISFEEDSAGKVTGLIFHQGGHDSPGERSKRTGCQEERSSTEV